MFNWILGFVIGGFLLLTGFQLIPVYMDNHAINKIVADVVTDDELKKRPKREVLGELEGRFAASDIDLKPKEVVKLARDTNGELVVDVKYEQRRKLMYNLEIVAGFDEQFTN